MYSTSLENFKSWVKYNLEELLKDLNVEYDKTHDPLVLFDFLIKETYKRYNKPIVILVDEYNKPITDLLEDPQKYKRAKLY